MDFKTFLENFDAIAEAPGGIPKLRSLILEMAVRGKLVPQNPEDREAKFDIDDIRNRVKKLQKEGRIRKQQKALPLSDELPYRIPIKWNWVRFVDVASIESNLVKPDDFSHYPHIAPNHIEKDTGKLLQYQTVLADEVTSAKHRFFPGQLIYSKIRPNLNKVVLVDFEGLCSADMYPISTGLYPRYLLLYMLSQTFLIQVTSSDNRLAMPKVNQDQLSQILIAVPPIVEQKRIVEKVDELMGLCDRYEAAKQTRDNLRQKLRESAIASLMNAETDEELDAAWASIHDNWRDFSQRPEDVSNLRQVVLQLAVQGKLVRHTSSFRKPLENFLTFQNGYAFKSEWYEPTGLRLVRNQNIGHGNLRWHDVKYISPQKTEEFKRFALREGDIVLSLDRPIINTGLKVARISAEDIPSLLLQRVARPLFKDDSLSSEYLFMWLNSPEFIGAIDPGRSNGVPHISTGVLEKIEILIPSIAEQKRIVAKVDELMKLCDQLEASLRQSQQWAESLAASAISHLII